MWCRVVPPKKKRPREGSCKERSKSQRKGTPGCSPHPPPLSFYPVGLPSDANASPSPSLLCPRSGCNRERPVGPDLRDGDDEDDWKTQEHHQPAGGLHAGWWAPCRQASTRVGEGLRRTLGLLPSVCLSVREKMPSWGVRDQASLSHTEGSGLGREATLAIVGMCFSGSSPTPTGVYLRV